MPYLTPLLSRAAAITLLLGGLVSPVWAEKADRDKPMNAEADAMRHDDLKQLTVFTGNVVITKGTTTLRGARVEVSQTPDGYQRAQVFGAPGASAHYRTKRDGVNEFIEGEGELIEYDGSADAVLFTRRAVLRRFEGATLADETSGAVIRYDNGRDVFTVDGAPRTAGASGGRVRAQLTPRQKPAATAEPAPAGPTLRPSTTLDKDRK